MVYKWQQVVEGFAVTADATHRSATEVHTVVAFFTADEFDAAAFATRCVVSQGNFQRGIGRFRTRVGEECLVEAFRRHRHQTLSGLETDVMAHVKERCEIQFFRLFGNRIGNALVTMTCVHTPQTRATVQNLAAFVIGKVHAFGRSQNTWVFLKGFVGRKRHPQSI